MVVGAVGGGTPCPCSPLGAISTITRGCCLDGPPSLLLLLPFSCVGGTDIPLDNEVIVVVDTDDTGIVVTTQDDATSRSQSAHEPDVVGNNNIVVATTTTSTSLQPQNNESHFHLVVNIVVTIVNVIVIVVTVIVATHLFSIVDRRDGSIFGIRDTCGSRQ